MIFLHIGAHKTATTYLQSLMELNQGKIAAGGRAYWRLDQTRPGIESGIAKYGSGLVARYLLARRHPLLMRGAVRELDSMLSSPTPSIISEENILGYPRDCLHGRLYPNATMRLRFIKSLVKERPMEIFLCVRGYPAFLSSSYAEALRHGYLGSMIELVKQNRGLRGQWSALAASVHHVFPNSRIVVWSYEDFKAVEAIVIERLTGLPIQSLTPLTQQDVRPSASAQAIALQSERAESMSRPERMQSMAMLEYQFPAKGAAAKFQPWAADMMASMTAAYESDLKTIRALPYVDALTT